MCYDKDMNNPRQIIISVFVLVIVGLGIFFLTTKKENSTTLPGLTQSEVPPPPDQIVYPIDRANERVTKKTFGTHVSPGNSPVSPERFTGYHTGVDFEAFPEEANSDVPIYAICDGKIAKKETARGYGGMLVQSCTLDNQPVVVVYGHVSLKSIAKNIGDILVISEKIGNLGQPPGETDGERKHLHLGIHKGTSMNTSGYVATQAQLSGWLDPRNFIK